jgi:ATP-dependent DNA helicase RecG
MASGRYIALIDDLRKLKTEPSWLEFKVSNADPDRIGRTVSAISNAARLYDKSHGYMIWGIDDTTHDVVGTIFTQALKRGNQNIEFLISQRLSPSITFIFHEVQHPSGHRLVILEIPAALSIPTKYENIAYIRIGDATPKLADYPEREAELIRKLQPFLWEGGIASTFLTDEEVLLTLDFETYFALSNMPRPATPVAILNRLTQDKLIMEDVDNRWKITNLGALLFARSITDFEGIKRKAIRIVKYNGFNTASASEFMGKGGYVAFFIELFRHINSNIPKNEQLKEAIRVETPVYPEIAIRELVPNALIHQDMTITGSGPMGRKLMYLDRHDSFPHTRTAFLAHPKPSHKGRHSLVA